MISASIPSLLAASVYRMVICPVLRIRRILRCVPASNCRQGLRPIETTQPYIDSESRVRKGVRKGTPKLQNPLGKHRAQIHRGPNRDTQSESSWFWRIVHRPILLRRRAKMGKEKVGCPCSDCKELTRVNQAFVVSEQIILGKKGDLDQPILVDSPTQTEYFSGGNN